MTTRCTLEATCERCNARTTVTAPGLEVRLPLPWFVILPARVMPAALPPHAAFCGRLCLRAWLAAHGDRGTTYHVDVPGDDPVIWPHPARHGN